MERTEWIVLPRILNAATPVGASTNNIGESSSIPAVPMIIILSQNQLFQSFQCLATNFHYVLVE